MLALSGGYLTTGNSLGDVRISLSGRSATQATVAAKFVSGTGYGPKGYQQALGPWPSQTFGWFGKHTKPLEKLEPGLLSRDGFIKLWRSEIATQAWIIRGVTFLIMLIAFELILQPLAVAADLLRMLNWCTCCLGTLLDNLAQCLIHTIAIVSAIFLWLLTFAVAWVVARPLLGIILLVVDIAGIAALVVYARRRKSSRDVTPLISMEGGYTGATSPAQMNMGVPVQPPAVQERISMQPVASPVMMNVTCPAGVGPGGLVSLQSPSGQQVNVTVPAGVYPGQQFTVQVPA